LQKFPNFTPEEVKQALDMMADADVERYEKTAETEERESVTDDES
jgi:acyl-CoA synthetase (NDP forming)